MMIHTSMYLLYKYVKLIESNWKYDKRISKNIGYDNNYGKPCTRYVEVQPLKDLIGVGSTRLPGMGRAARRAFSALPGPCPALLGPKISVFNCHLESQIRESYHGTEFL